MEKYEIMIILLPDIGEEASNKELDEVRASITENGGEIYHEDIWGVREMAYKIKKEKEGFYAVFNFNLDPLKVKKLEKPLILNQNVIRFLVTKTPPNYEIKTLEEYEEQAAKEKAETEAKKKEKADKDVRSKPKPRPKKEEPKEEKTEKPVKAEKEEKTEEPKTKEPKEKVEKKEEPKKEEKKEEKKAAKLDDVDERLKSIIDDPDISL